MVSPSLLQTFVNTRHEPPRYVRTEVIDASCMHVEGHFCLSDGCSHSERSKSFCTRPAGPGSSGRHIPARSLPIPSIPVSCTPHLFFSHFLGSI